MQLSRIPTITIYTTYNGTNSARTAAGLSPLPILLYGTVFRNQDPATDTVFRHLLKTFLVPRY